MDISLILPAYNEEKTIVNTIVEARAYFESRGLAAQLIVAADGKDRTRDLAREIPGVVVIGSPERSGKGKGIRLGVERAVGKIIGFADADNKVPIEEFDRFLPLLREDHDVVIGSRAQTQSKIEKKQPFYRQLGSKGFYVFVKAVVGLPGIRDSQCGFKFFRHDWAKKVFGLQKIDGYMYDVEILAIAQKLGARVAQVPIRWRDDADSRLELVAGNIQNVKDIFRIRSLVREL
ncbi:MAG: glycosyltransferase family 2 protein [Acidobacteria bacterium]|nr:glycosyltransferase family 2 protein [Acidobacteriota bacterium]